MADLAPEISIRRMKVEDVPVVHALDVLSFNLPWSERSFRYEVTENANARTWVAEVPQPGPARLVGMLVLWFFLDEAHIATLAIHPEFRRRGIARRILQIALNAAYREGARRAFLEVRAGNQAAILMYQELGFEEVGRRPRYYHDNNEDALLMTLENLHIYLSTQ
ncbi:MAG: ribosomal-protein-alanine N-acetyltransferase [Chloroflexi bacterium GWB2_49_20]|nr:MAG: ribosomal-protein-alanine N-acetyltransferase [Chloroflexi bacterium GWB2_49_20]OGN80306.1 MAG: ribosomal-protein-alanine N-acetyltransferase [Chloroflexi bacterium GWC2_49_37]OGN86054.1 MAG: ribosomal-protein-alanine N-acetyltransferase [Chloroflexi bacterium GWD2_49_16]HCC79356.1 ribosomal-protein-alanine N-acetyltransferase [Anaerolineae bacterium]HCM96422.1 ribosomal-protein-alanine N-acetyltransferase [Anaerolineae bacterium]